MNKKNGRVIVLLMDSLGIGASLDASKYGDEGANTFAHIYDACFEGKADVEGLRKGPLRVPNLAKYGMYHAVMASSARSLLPLAELPEPTGYYGYAVEQSFGKDTPSGHWEICGVPVLFDWGYFPLATPCFPPALTDGIMREAGIPGFLGNKHASGTTIIEELGAEHIETGMPILYTSADSVFQIAAHETYFGLDRLYALCEIARKWVDDYKVGRVIARPFVGEPGSFKRTANRKDYATPPPAPTLLDYLKEQGREVVAIGKTADIFAHRGISKTLKADGNMALFDATLKALETLPPGGLIFTNFVDFDSSYGHRRDVAGYAASLEQFDARLPELMARLNDDDLVLISADHGCDPTWPGSDHTREHVPVLVFGNATPSRFIGRRDSFADMGQTLAEHLDIAPLANGISFLS